MEEDTPLDISEEDIRTAVRVLECVSVREDVYMSHMCRQLRCALQPLIHQQVQHMYGGVGPLAYLDNKDKKRIRRQEQQRRKLEDERLLLQTKLRAGRMKRLEAAEEKNGRAYPLVMDGVGTTDNDANMPTCRSSKLITAENEEASGQSVCEKPHLNTIRRCYICKVGYQELHEFYDSLCPKCADLNWMKRTQKCDMTGRVCLVTGARVKIGFQCCLKLLRCGAIVVATSRFPVDTARRYAEQPDFSEWSHRLHVHGLDLRDLAYVEVFCDMILRTYSRLDVIISNACQTVRRPAAFYSHMLETERSLGKNQGEGVQTLLHRETVFLRECAVSRGCRRRIGDENQIRTEDISHGQSTPLLYSSAELSQIPIAPEDTISNTEVNRFFPTTARDVNEQQIDLRRVNSWLLNIDQVSTPELVEVFAINSISPFVMAARLKPLLVREQNRDLGESEQSGGLMSLADFILSENDSETKKKAGSKGSVHGEKAPLTPASSCSFIVNVSSMEGKFYRRKMTAHPHTNMAKAALNMMTRTVAVDYQRSGIYMTAVDTGWINDENPIEKAAEIAANQNFTTPLDEVDAAARILDPVLSPLIEAEGREDKMCRPPYGCFLKDYFLSEW